MFEKSKLKFLTEKQKSRRRAVFISIAIALIAALLLSVSTVVLLKNKNSSSKEKEQPAIKKSAYSENLPDNAKILILIPESDRSDILYLGILNINSAKDKLYLSPVDKKNLIQSENMTIAEYYEKKGIVTTVAQLETSKNIKIDRYVAIHRGNIGALFKVTGPLEKNFDSEINYQDSDFRLQIKKGPKKISGNEMIKLLKYLEKSHPSDYAIRQSTLVAEYLNQSFGKENLSKGDTFFNSFVNLADTNISVVDFAKYKDYLIHLDEKEIEVEVKKYE
ncbi:MAG: hypothetical protein Q4E28_01615 [Clostridia bacterium]|nr:hypothetical protein [Clostridia bacterium]